jgi:DNA-binding transcriptional regulator GbsR (MarR family)
VVGERREHFEAETSIWKLVSRVLRERELQWIRTAHEQFQAAADELRPATRSAAKRHALIEQRIAGLVQLAQVGAALLESILQEKTVDALPIKTVGELAKVVRGKGDPET